MIESSSCSADDYSSVAGSYSASPFQTGASYSPTIDSLPTQLSPNEEMYTCVVALQNSQSTPDLLKELGSTLSAEREKKKNQPNVVQSKRIGSSSNNGAEVSKILSV